MKPMQFANRVSLIRAAAVAAYVALIVLAIGLTWNAVFGLSEQHASMSATERMLAQLESRSSGHTSEGSPLAAAPAGSPFLEGQTLNVAGAALLQRVATVVHRLGGNILSSQVDLESERAKEGWISLLVSCDLEQPALQDLLYDIESGMPFLFIDQLAVQAPTSGVNSSKMRVLITISGQWWKDK